MNAREDPLTLPAADEDERLARLIAVAGPPPPAPEIEIARIQEAARAEWRRRYAWRRARRRLRWQLAAAAAVVAAIGVLLWQRPSRPGSPAVASIAAVERVEGDVRVVAADGEADHALAAGEPLAAGAIVRSGGGATAGGRLALRWSDGRSLRLDRDSELVLAAAGAVELRRGGLYLDSREAPAGGGPAIETPRGRFRELGTQFEVRLVDGADGGVRLRVREGAVEWREDGRTTTAEAGVELTLGADGTVARGRVATHGAEWVWVLAAAPGPAIDGWSVARFLAWYGRESGLAVTYADRRSDELAASVVVHGSVARLAPADALDAVLASSGFAARVEDGALVVAAQAEAGGR